MADIVIETTETTETLIAIVRRVMSTRGTVIDTEGTVETGGTAGAHPHPAGVFEDTRLNTGVEEATQGVHQGGEVLAASGGRTVHVVPASPPQTVQIHVGEVDTVAEGETVTGSTSSSNFYSCNTRQNACPNHNRQ